VQTLGGDGTRVVKGVLVPQTNEIGVGIGVLFPTGTQFRVTLTASTPLTFDGSATFG
jgi:mannose-6-phosphate isomerase-like protein (cupin superfamily)